MRYPSFSRLQRALACPASHVLPQTPSETPQAALGTELHAALQTHVEGRECPQQHRDWAEACVEACGDFLAPSVLAETAWCLDAEWVTGEALGANLGRDYGTATSRGYCGAADYVRVEGGVARILDLKTGFSEVPPPHTNAQLLAAACAVADVHGVTRVEVGLLLAPPRDVQPRVTWAEVSMDALDAFRARLRALTETLRALAAGTRRVEDEVHEGPQCRYCPARAACPAMARREAEALALPQTRIEVTATNAGEVWAMVDAARAVLDELKAACIQVALREGGVRLPDGRMRRQVVREVATWDAEVVWRVLAARWGAEVARAAMTLETSRAGVSRAVDAARRMGAEGSRASLVREVEAAVENAGGRGVKTRTEWVDE